jgi:hypothetical protein
LQSKWDATAYDQQFPTQLYRERDAERVIKTREKLLAVTFPRLSRHTVFISGCVTPSSLPASIPRRLLLSTSHPTSFYPTPRHIHSTEPAQFTGSSPNPVYPTAAETRPPAPLHPLTTARACGLPIQEAYLPTSPCVLMASPTLRPNSKIQPVPQRGTAVYCVW